MVRIGFSQPLRIYVLISSVFCLVYNQELAHFNKSSSVDFEKDKVWAEILPGDIKETKADQSETNNVTTSEPIVRANIKNVRSQTSSYELVTIARVGRALAGRDTTESGEAQTTRKSNVLSDVTNGDHGENTPPYITNPVSNIRRQIIWNDYPKTFQCEAQGHPQPEYTWYQDGTKLGAIDKRVKAYRNGTLYFQSFTREDDGEYNCKAVNKHGTDVSVTFQILRAHLPDAKIKDTETVLVKKWQKLSVPCGDTPQAVSAAKRWYIETKVTQLVLNNRVGTDAEGTLHFAYTELGDSNIYHCGLANILGIKVYNPRAIQVQDASDTGDSGPNPEYITQNAKAIINEEFYLECFFSGKPAPTITWKNNKNQDIPVAGSDIYRIEDFGRRLTIIKVRQEDEGTYTCMARNAVDVAEASIKVNVTSPPMRTDGSLRSHTKPDQEDFVLPCKAVAAAGEMVDPPIWYRNGERLTKNNLLDRYSFNDDFTELTIKQLVKHVDTASYQCRVKNSEGELYMNGYLRVINSIEIARQPSETIKVSSNSTDVFDITVLAKGDSCCDISIFYYFNNTQIPEIDLHKPPFRKNDSTETVMFDPSSVSKEVLSKWMGEYRCDVSDRYQHKNVYFAIVAKDVSPEPQVAVANTASLWWIGIVCGVLAILIVVIIVFAIYKSNYPGDTYQLEKTELKHNLNPEEDLLNQSFQEI